MSDIFPPELRDVIKIGHDLLPVGSSASGTVAGKTFFLLQVIMIQPFYDFQDAFYISLTFFHQVFGVQIQIHVLPVTVLLP